VLNYTNMIYTFLVLKNVHVWLTVNDYLPGHLTMNGNSKYTGRVNLVSNYKPFDIHTMQCLNITLHTNVYL